MSKRKNGEGNYGKRTINGSAYHYYRSPNDGWVVYGKTLAEVKQKKAAKEKAMAEYEEVNEKLLTVSELCKRWLLSRKNEVSAGTYDNYEDIMTSMIIKFEDYDIGNRQVQGITVEAFEDYLGALAKKYSKNSIDRTWTIIKQSIEYGQRRGLVSTKLNIKDVKKPNEQAVAVKKKEPQFTTIEDVEILYKEAYRLRSNGQPVYGNASKILVFVMYSGLRISEAIGLRWKYVSRDFSEITVQQTSRKVALRNEDGSPVMTDGHKTYQKVQKDPKTSSGKRIVPLPDRGIEILKFFDQEFPNHTPDDNVFLTPKGTLFLKENVERTLTRMINNSDCSNKDYTPHSLRHGYGSILLSEGVDIKTISVLLGHKDVSTTYNIYIHILEDDKKKAVRDVFNKKR